ncbi:MAG: ABC transporter ATP-binding protein [Burkholderiaceae bacterium]
MAEVRLTEITKSYDGQALAVNDLNLLCPQGEMLALLGPSGCGKSSTLKMIAGIEEVSSGTIEFDGIDVTELDSAGRNVAMVFEDYSLYPHLSTFENIAFPLRVRSVAGHEVDRKVNAAVELLGLQAFMDTPVRSLSGGAQQRVSIGRALVRDPALVMFDEPLSHLDADQKVILRTEIRRLQATAGLTSVLVTHDQTEAMAMADTIAVLDHGQLQQVGSPRELYEQPANLFVAGFIGDTPMNFIRASTDANGGRISVGDQSDPLPMGIDGQHTPALLIGIRPEDIRVKTSETECDAGFELTASVHSREPAGDRTVLSMCAGAVNFQMELPSPCRYRPDDQLACWFPVDRIHGFDAESGQLVNLAKLSC